MPAPPLLRTARLSSLIHTLDELADAVAATGLPARHYLARSDVGREE